MSPARPAAVVPISPSHHHHHLQCVPSSTRDYNYRACLSWCGNNTRVNCPRCKCQACSFCSSKPTFLSREITPPLSPPSLPPPPPPPPLSPLSLGPDHGLCASLAPASLIVGDSVSGQFFRALVELLLGGGSRRPPKLPDRCAAADTGCKAMHALPAYAQRAHLCDGRLWLAYMRNDWCDVAPSYPVPDGGYWHCARTVSQFSPDLRVALRRTTYLCGDPEPSDITCDTAPCVTGAVTPACASTCSLASQNFSCGTSRVDPCVGCSAAWSVPTMCESQFDRSAFCAATERGAPTPSEAETFHTAHCSPWSSLPMLRLFRVLILNAGAHRVPVGAYRQQMRRLGSVIRSYLRGEEFSEVGGTAAVFRTTVPGFSGCDQTHSARQLGSTKEAEAFLASHPFYQQHQFVPVANRIAAMEISHAGGLVLDVYPPSIVRLDDRSGANTYHGGVDCLHYRMPLLNTSLGLWARMLGYRLHRRWLDTYRRSQGKTKRQSE